MYSLSFISYKVHFLFRFDTAPGTYSPEKMKQERGPQYSLTGKSQIEKCNGTPGTRENVHLFYESVNVTTNFFFFVFNSAGCVLSRESEIGRIATVQFRAKTRHRETKRYTWYINESRAFNRMLMSRYNICYNVFLFQRLVRTAPRR